MTSLKAFLLILCALFATGIAGQNRALKEMLADSSLTGTSYSICVADISSGEIILDYDAVRNLTPASVMKLYPTAVALSLLGPEYCFSTTIGITGNYDHRKGVLSGDIIINGGGDPTLGSPYFTDHYGDVIGRWVKALTSDYGLRHVTGRVIAIQSCYDFQPVPPGWAWEDIGNYYGAGVFGINYNDNSYNIYVTGNAESTPATIDSIDEYGKNISISNYLTSSGRTDKGFVFAAPYSHEAFITGTVPANSSIILKASMPDPPLTVARFLTERLEKAGVIIDAEPFAERMISLIPPSKAILTEHSPYLADIIKVTNHESINLYAEQMCKHLGYEIAGEGSFKAGLKVIREFLDSIGCNPSQAVILDASGMSPNNRISALMTVKLLLYMYHSSERDTYIGSLPPAGSSGTMQNSFKDRIFQGRVVAKSGSMTGVRSFGGYITTASGRVLAFTMIANGYIVPGKQITERMERIIAEIITYY